MQVDPIKPKLKPPGTKRLKLNCDVLLSTSAFKFNLRRYSAAGLENLLKKRGANIWTPEVGRCRLTLSTPR